MLIDHSLASYWNLGLRKQYKWRRVLWGIWMHRKERTFKEGCQQGGYCTSPGVSHKGPAWHEAAAAGMVMKGWCESHCQRSIKITCISKFRLLEEKTGKMTPRSWVWIKIKKKKLVKTKHTGYSQQERVILKLVAKTV